MANPPSNERKEYSTGMHVMADTQQAALQERVSMQVSKAEVRTEGCQARAELLPSQ